jgi:hypothetical protein
VNPLDGDVGYKVYACGVGLLKDGPLSLIGYTKGEDDGEDTTTSEQR